MLSDIEIQEFLALLLAFSLDTRSSGRNMSELFGISVKTMARWMQGARHQGVVDRMYYSRVDPIKLAIQRMNSNNEKHSSYARVAAIAMPSKKVEALKTLMAQAA